MVRGILKFNRICPTGVKCVLIRILSIFSKLVTKTTFNNNTKDTRSILCTKKFKNPSECSLFPYYLIEVLVEQIYLPKNGLGLGFQFFGYIG